MTKACVNKLMINIGGMTKILIKYCAMMCLRKIGSYITEEISGKTT